MLGFEDGSNCTDGSADTKAKERDFLEELTFVAVLSHSEMQVRNKKYAKFGVQTFFFSNVTFQY